MATLREIQQAEVDATIAYHKAEDDAGILRVAGLEVDALIDAQRPEERLLDDAGIRAVDTLTLHVSATDLAGKKYGQDFRVGNRVEVVDVDGEESQWMINTVSIAADKTLYTFNLQRDLS